MFTHSVLHTKTLFCTVAKKNEKVHIQNTLIYILTIDSQASLAFLILRFDLFQSVFHDATVSL